MLGFPDGSDGRVCLRAPGEGNDNPTPVPLPGKSHGWRSPGHYSPWRCKVLDTTEQCHYTLCLSFIF